jgi:hypothetical protein
MFIESTSSTISVRLLLLVICPLDRLGCLGVTKVVVDLGKFVLPSPLWGFVTGDRTRSW